MHLGVPLARSLGVKQASANDGNVNDPLVHVVEPFVDASILHARGDEQQR